MKRSHTFIGLALLAVAAGGASLVAGGTLLGWPNGPEASLAAGPWHRAATRKQISGLRIRYHVGTQVFETVVDDEYEVRPA